MSLIDQITIRKEELAKVIDRKENLENEIAELEQKWNREKINNQMACLDPVKLVDGGGCRGCRFEDQCSYEGKNRKFKL